MSGDDGVTKAMGAFEVPERPPGYYPRTEPHGTLVPHLLVPGNNRAALGGSGRAVIVSHHELSDRAHASCVAPGAGWTWSLGTPGHLRNWAEVERPSCTLGTVTGARGR